MTDLIHFNDKSHELIEMANRLGHEKLILVKEIRNYNDFKKWKTTFSKIKSETDLVFGVEVNTNSSKKLQNLINQIRNDTEIIAVKGGDYNINRAVVENEKIDILLNPDEGRTDRGLDDYTCKQAIENNVLIATSFRKILECYKKSRSFKILFILQNINLLKSKNFITISDAHSKWELRSNKNMDDFLTTISNDLYNSEKLLDQKIITNRIKLKETLRGVRVLDEEE